MQNVSSLVGLSRNFEDFKDAHLNPLLKGASINGFSRFSDQVTKGLTAGSIRAADHELFTVVENLLHQRRNDSQPLRVLEVGSGVSFPAMSLYDRQDLDEGAPWFARALKSKFGDRLDITASDIQPVNFQIIAAAVSNSMVISTFNLTKPIFEESENIFPEIYRNMRYPLMDLDVLTGNISLAEDYIYCSRAKKLFSEASVSPEIDQITFFPAIHSQFEQELYGIKYVPEVDFLDLKDKFGDQKFDLIYGRHLFPPDPDIKEDIFAQAKSSALAVLADRGKIMLCFDVYNEPITAL